MLTPHGSMQSGFQLVVLAVDPARTRALSGLCPSHTAPKICPQRGMTSMKKKVICSAWVVHVILHSSAKAFKKNSKVWVSAH
jgi:hypothetical protein